MLDKLVSGQLIKCIDNSMVEYMLDLNELYHFKQFIIHPNGFPHMIQIDIDRQPMFGYENARFALPNYDEINEWYDCKEKLLKEERRKSIKIHINSMK